MKRWLSGCTLEQTVFLVFFFLFAWYPDLFAIWLVWNLNLSCKLTLTVWQVRLMFLLGFAALGYGFFRPKQGRLDPRRRLYAARLFVFLIGIVFYYLLITFRFKGVVALDDLEIETIQTEFLGWSLIYPRYYFSWHNYLLYPALIFICLFWRLIFEVIKTKWTFTLH